MGQSAPQVFSGITPVQWARLIAKAQASGIDLRGNSGTASQYGVEVAWDYSPASLDLKIQCLRTPFFVSPEDVNAKIAALVKETMGPTASS